MTSLAPIARDGSTKRICDFLRVPSGIDWDRCVFKVSVVEVGGVVVKTRSVLGFRKSIGWRSRTGMGVVTGLHTMMAISAFRRASEVRSSTPEDVWLARAAGVGALGAHSSVI